jgi:hypothetical protein
VSGSEEKDDPPRRGSASELASKRACPVQSDRSSEQWQSEKACGRLRADAYARRPMAPRTPTAAATKPDLALMPWAALWVVVGEVDEVAEEMREAADVAGEEADDEAEVVEAVAETAPVLLAEEPVAEEPVAEPEPAALDEAAGQVLTPLSWTVNSPE